MHIQFFSSSFLAVVLLHLSFSSLSYASDENDFFLKNSLNKQIPDMTNKQLPDWLKAKPVQLDSELEELLQEGNRNHNNQQTTKNFIQPSNKNTQGRWIFVSFGMPDHEIKEAAQEAANNNAVLVFRGVERNGDTGSITKKLYQVVKKMDPPPRAVIDPLLYSLYGVTKVPTLVEVNSSSEMRTVKGLLAFRWLSNQEPGDYGLRGQVFDIKEPDMIEEMKQRMESYDWEKEKKNALDNFWKHQEKFLEIPPSHKSTERIIDPSIIASKDIVSPDGTVIIHKGKKINPQLIIPMRYTYVVFDATDDKQVEIVKKLGDKLLIRQRPVVYLFSKMHTENGWKHYNNITALLNAPIYKLNSTIVQRFTIKALPTSVEGNGSGLLIKEYSVNEGLKN